MQTQLTKGLFATWHCADCQKLHRNIHAFSTLLHDAVSIEGEVALVWHQSSPASRCAFCGTCGVRGLEEIPSQGRGLVSTRFMEWPAGKRISRTYWKRSKPELYPSRQVPA